MDELKKRYQRSPVLHHAYVIPGEVETLLLAVRDFSDNVLGIGIGNADYYERSFDSLGVDEARELKEVAYLAPLGDRRVFVLGIPAITREAQNALLKLLEEPPTNVHFFLLVPSEDMLLPTVRSRTELLRIQSEGDTDLASTFLAQAPEARIETIKKILDKKDKTLAISFLRNLEEEIASRSREKGSVTSKLLEPVIFAETYIRDPGSSAKLLLEYVAITIPVLKKGQKD